MQAVKTDAGQAQTEAAGAGRHKQVQTVENRCRQAQAGAVRRRQMYLRGKGWLREKEENYNYCAYNTSNRVDKHGCLHL